MNVFITLLQECERNGQALLVLDVPLLFEKGLEGGVDGILVVTAPEIVQRERVLLRPTMTAEKLDQILARQVRLCTWIASKL